MHHHSERHGGHHQGGEERRGHGVHHGGHHHRGESGGPGPGFPWGMGFRRRFFTREERIARLEAYLEGLRAEAKGVEERIAAIKAAEQ